MLSHCTPRLPVAAVLALLLVVAAGCMWSDEPTDISFGEHTLKEGTYKFSWDGTTVLLFDVPAGLRLEVPGNVQNGAIALLLEDLDSRSWVGIEVHSGRESHRWIDPARSDITALFDELMTSVRVNWLPTPTPDRFRVAALADRRMAEIAAPPRDISGWQFTTHTLTRGIYQFALNPHEQPLIFEVPDGLRPRVSFTGSMGDTSDQWCPGLLLIERRTVGNYSWDDSWLCLDVHRAAELSRALSAKSQERGFRPQDYGGRLTTLVSSLRLGPVPSPGDAPPCAPLIVVSPLGQLLTGGTSHLLRPLGTEARFVIIDVPVGVTLVDLSVQYREEPDGSKRGDSLHLTEATSGSRLVIDLATGGERMRQVLGVPAPYDVDPGAAFDQILASLRFDELPAVPGCPAPLVPFLEQTLGPGRYRYHITPRDYRGDLGVPDITFEVPAGLQLNVWDGGPPHQIILEDAVPTSGPRSSICLDAERVVECSGWNLGPLFERISESLRLGTAP